MTLSLSKSILGLVLPLGFLERRERRFRRRLVQLPTSNIAVARWYDG